MYTMMFHFLLVKKSQKISHSPVDGPAKSG